jgi:UDP-N-acetylmuramoyl-tripeptide--D-alanyl-D-alanine ligase
MINNKAAFDLKDILILFKAEELNNFFDNWSCRGVSIDSRTIGPGNLFVAIKGDNFDGNEKIPEAFEKGAAAAIVDKKWFDNNKYLIPEKPIIMVDSTITALGKLGNFHRMRFDYPVIAVGGSNGKTTTKEMIATVLSKKFNVLKTYKNLNNQIGAPMMLLQMDDTYQAAVLEIGTNEPGEITILSDILYPTHGIITNIGKEHLEKLIDIKGVEMEETFLFGHLDKKGALCFINIDDPRLNRYVPVIDEKLLYGLSPKATIRGEIDFDSEFRTNLKLFSDNKQTFIQMNTYGYTSGLNALAAATVGIHFEVPLDDIKSALEEFRQDNSNGYSRMLFEKIKDFTVINDCYNANPSSTSAALDNLKMISSDGRKIAVLGDMLELGEASSMEHSNIISQARESSDNILLIGEEMSRAIPLYNDNKNLRHFRDKNGLITYLKENIQPGDIVLIKGSRGMKMEEIIAALKI